MKYLFSKDNFIKIFYQENKKGKPLEGRLERLHRTKRANDIVKDKKDNQAPQQEYEQALRIRRITIEQVMSKIEKDVAETKIQIGVAPQFIKNKQVYQYESEPATSLLIDKQIQENVKKAFGIRMPSHKEIVAQVKSLFNNDMEKYICRLDIKSFFESIPHLELKMKISKNQKLDAFSKNTIFQILDQYATITSSLKGIPRGIGLSSCLAEVYMQDFDRKIRSWDSVFFYARFVDDFVIFSTSNIYNQIVRCIDEYKLTINSQKKLVLHYNGGCKPFEFLGYEFQKKGKDNINITLSVKKIEKIKNKIKTSIDAYNQAPPQAEPYAWRILNQRLRFLTGNTRLANTKSNIFVGIYYSNSFITNDQCMSKIDSYLKDAINNQLQFNSTFSDRSIKKCRQKLEKRYSFLLGFKTQKFHPFTYEQVKEITKIWKDL